MKYGILNKVSHIIYIALAIVYCLLVCGGLPPEAQPISAMPEVLIEAREPAKDEFLVIACDGIFDVT